MTSEHTPQKILKKFKGKDILSLDQFTPADLQILFALTNKMKRLAVASKPSTILSGKVVTLIFYEPSSRTFGSFAAAVKRLGGQTVEIQNPTQFSSVSKGETFEDTIMTFESYADAIILRHPVAGSAQEAATAAKHIPIVNAGDGIGEHPTQALLDLYTIYEAHGKLNKLVGVMAGDLLNGRTIHSLIRGLSLYKGTTLYLLAPERLRLSREDFEHFTKRGIKLIEIDREEKLPKNAHFWYWTRVQKERFEDIEEYEKVKNRFVVTKKILDTYGGKKTVLMHPLPRVGEILTEVDEDPRAIYLTKQMRNGMYVRMALLALILGKK